MDLAALGTLFFLQVTVILAVARITGYLAQRYLMQPRVVGEMIAGVLLGPSLFGAFSPDMQAALFPADTRPILYVIAQMGVGLYMFIVGLGFDRKDFAVNAKGAAIVSVAGMAAPFLAAVLLVPWLLQQGGLFGEGIDALQATLFLGAAIAITAFPMLARIIHERGITAVSYTHLTLPTSDLV